MKNQRLVIKVPFPTLQYEAYLAKVGVYKETQMTLPQIESVFVMAVSDFEDGTISSDSLAAICHTLFNILVKRSGAIKSRLFDVVLAGSELSYYVRSPDSVATLGHLLHDVLDYRNASMKNREKGGV